MILKDFSSIVEKAKKKETKKLVVAAADDESVLLAVQHAKKDNIIQPILVGNGKEIERISEKISFDLKGVEIISTVNQIDAAYKAVSAIHDGEGDILMKGMISTGTLLKVVLDKDIGLKKQKMLSHVAFIESPYYHKVFCITDVAMNITPDLKEKVLILNNAIEAFNRLGVETPKVAVVAAVEIVNPNMDATLHAAALSQMYRRGQIPNCIIDGPFAIDNAVSLEAAEHKGIISDVAGDCDIILAPDINSGNVLYKTLRFLGGGTPAAVIMGASVPFVLTSRSDSDESKYLSIALATAME